MLYLKSREGIGKRGTMGNKILVYTREPIDNVLYDARLAYSMHLAIYKDGKYEALNHNSGVLFPLATENENGSLNPKCLKNPYIFKGLENSFGVVAVRTGADGEEDNENIGNIILWESRDLVQYTEIGMVPCLKQRIACAYVLVKQSEKKYELIVATEDGKWFQAECDNIFTVNSAEKNSTEKDSTEKEGLKFVERVAPSDKELAAAGMINESIRKNISEEIQEIQGVIPSSIIEISEEAADRLRKKLTTPVNVAMEFPDRIQVSSKEELLSMTATAVYSDTTTASKKIDWDLENVDFTNPGEYELTGKVHKEHFPFPIAFNRADPCMTKWKGKYYFIATNDADKEHTLYIREADSIPQLVDAEEHLILDSTTYEGIGGLLWAPEFHEIQGKLYIFHACTPGEFFWEESHLMALKDGGNPICREDWSAPRRIVRKDGSELCEAGKTITLDMTCFLWEGSYYVIWSQREFLPKDLGAWLYIAKLNPKEPWKLLTDPVVLSKPDYGWANNHTFVDEGPFALLRGDKLYITFSSAAVDTSYVVSYLTIDAGKDLLDAKNWRKNNYPILTSRSVEGEFGTGHNAYVVDDDGTIWNTYHARPGVDGVRSSGVRRVHFDIDGCPVLDMTEDMDVKEQLRDIKTKLIIS